MADKEKQRDGQVVCRYGMCSACQRVIIRWVADLSEVCRAYQHNLRANNK
jgi:hypothetical protein